MRVLVALLNRAVVMRILVARVLVALTVVLVGCCYWFLCLSCLLLCLLWLRFLSSV